MSQYIRVKPGTKAYEAMKSLWDYKKTWRDNKPDIEKFLGFNMDGVLYINTEVLTIERSALPVEWSDQFRLNTYPAEAKKKSKINKEWTELCKRLNLQVVNTIDVAIELGTFGEAEQYIRLQDNYIVEMKSEYENKTFEWGEPLTEIEYLRLRTKVLEEQERDKKGA